MKIYAIHVALVLVSACTAEDEAMLETTEQAAVVPPYLGNVVTCGTPASAGGLVQGTELQRFDIDLAAFPNARCNDGSPAVFYFRPAASGAGANRWIIQLQGGGGCRTPEDCARRWCRVDTNFGMTQMSSALAPPVGIDGEGILYRGPLAVSPFEDANHVFVRYCSSDTWAGRSGPLAVNAINPTTGAAITYSIDFRGADILDAVLATLRRAGAPAPVYTLDYHRTAMPDLDEASQVVLAGASAGGGGVINNGDRVRATFVARDLDGILDYRLLIDSMFGPNADDLDWNFSPLCTQAVCDWKDIFLPNNAMFPRDSDASCKAFHPAATDWMCDDTDHVIRHHVMSPMMVRMGLTDQLLSDNLITANVRDAAGNPMTVPLFAQLVRTQLLALPQIAVAGQREETAPVAPAVYGPYCSKHETLSNSAATFNVRIGKAGVPHYMFDVWSRWIAGAGGTQIVFAPGDAQICN